MADAWDQFPDAPRAPMAVADPWAQFPDAAGGAAAGGGAPPSLAMAPIGGAEMLLKAATGAVASIPAGLAYGGAAIAKAAGADVNPSQVMGKVQNALTYAPVSDSAKAGEQAFRNITQPVVAPVVRAADRAATSVGKVSPTAETLMREAPSALQAAAGVLPLASAVKPALAAARAAPEIMTPEAAARLSPEQAAAAPSQEALANGKGLGLKFTPSQEGRGAGSVVQGLTGGVKLERTLSKQNAKVVNAKAAKAIGLPENSPVTRQTIERARKPANRTYDEVSKLGAVATDDSWRAEIANVGDRSGNKSFPEDTPADIQKLKDIYGAKAGFDAGDAVAKVRSLRSNGFANIALREPEKQALGRAQLGIADALDNQLERHAQSLGQDDLVQRYRDARAQLATIHVVRRALKGSNVSARALSAQQERGVKLSGDLKTIADSYDVADRSLQDLGKIRDSSPFSVVDLFVGAGAGLHNPALAAAAVARPAARAILASEAYQRRGLPASQPPKPLKPVASNHLKVGPAVSAPAPVQKRTPLSDLMSQRR